MTKSSDRLEERLLLRCASAFDFLGREFVIRATLDVTEGHGWGLVRFFGGVFERETRSVLVSRDRDGKLFWCPWSSDCPEAPRDFSIAGFECEREVLTMAMDLSDERVVFEHLEEEVEKGTPIEEHSVQVVREFFVGETEFYSPVNLAVKLGRNPYPGEKFVAATKTDDFHWELVKNPKNHGRVVFECQEVKKSDLGRTLVVARPMQEVG